MCEQCRKQHIALDIRNVHRDTGQKYETAVGELSKALGYDSERQQKEVSPYRSVRDLEDASKNQVEQRLLELYNAIVSTWFGVQKAKADDPFVLNSRIFIDPKTGKPLTNRQWETIKKDILAAFDYIYAGESERIATHALALGKILKGMSIADSISAGYPDLHSQVIDTVDKLSGPLWRNTVTFANQHAATLITDVTQRQYTRIHNTIQTAIVTRKNHRELQSDLLEQFGVMNRDWRRIAETEIATAQNNGQLLTELERAAPGEQVYMRGISSSGACPFCRGSVDQQVVALLDAPPAGGDDSVTIGGDTFTAIWPGKSNHGRPRSRWWVAAGSQHPHTYSKDTEVLTDSGWKHFPDLDRIDRIMAINPETSEIGFVRFVTLVQHYQNTMVHLSGRNFDLMVTPEHRQLYVSHGKLFETSVQDLITRSEFALPRAVGTWRNGTYRPQCGMDEVTFARLWAWFLSDGSATQRRNYLQVHIRQKNMSCVKRDLGAIITDSGYIRTPVNALFRHFSGLRAWQKYVPSEVKRLTPEGLRAFLDAYVNSDGHDRTGKPSHAKSYTPLVRGSDRVLYTASPRLADDLTEIALKAGFMPNFTVREPSGTRHAVHVISLCKSKTRRFSLRRGVGSITEVPYCDTAYDVTLEKWHHLLVRRNGKTAWSGNCRCTWVKHVPGFEDIDAQIRAGMEDALRKLQNPTP